MSKITASIGALVLGHMWSRTFLEIFHAIHYDLQELGAHAHMIYGIDACDLEALLKAGMRPPAPGSWEVPTPFLWQKLFEEIEPQDCITIVLPPAAILEYFEGVLWKAELIRKKFPGLKDVWARSYGDLKRFRNDVERFAPGLMDFMTSSKDTGALVGIPGLYGFRRLWQEEKINPIQKALGGVTPKDLKVPPELNTQRGLEWLYKNRRRGGFRSEHADFHDIVDLLNLEVFAASSRVFSSMNLGGYMTTPGWLTRQAYLASWSGEENFSWPFRHSATAITLLMSRRRGEDDLDHFLTRGIMLLKHICKTIEDIPEVSNLVYDMYNIHRKEEVVVPQELEAAITYWRQAYFSYLYHVPLPPRTAERNIDQLIRLVEERDLEETGDEIFATIQEQARAVAEEGMLLDSEINEAFIPTSNPRTTEVLEWLGRPMG